MSAKPSVLFVCVKNAGKSQLAAGLMTDYVGDAVDVYSAGTSAGTAINELSAQSLLEVGIARRSPHVSARHAVNNAHGHYT